MVRMPRCIAFDFSSAIISGKDLHRILNAFNENKNVRVCMGVKTVGFRVNEWYQKLNG